VPESRLFGEKPVELLTERIHRVIAAKPPGKNKPKHVSGDIRKQELPRGLLHAGVNPITKLLSANLRPFKVPNVQFDCKD
jgi:hypothetical protein